MLSRSEAATLLNKLEAEHGSDVLRALVGVAMVADAEVLRADPFCTSTTTFVPHEWLADFDLPQWAYAGVEAAGF